MDLALSDEQEALVASFGDLFGKHASPEQVRAAEPLGFDAALWRALVEVGVVPMAVPEEHGGWGASLLDLALVAECVGAAVVPAPVIEAQCAARLLGSVPDHLVTIAVRPAHDGTATLVPAGAVADEAIVLDGDRLLLVRLHDDRRRRIDNLASAPLADVDIDGATELGHGTEAMARFDAVIDEWLVLTASALVGMAATAHRVTCEYVRERQAWDQPIGSYQGVAHPLANGITAIDGARLLTAQAAWALGRGDARGRELAAMAFAFASETARDVTYDAIHFHGGYGFMLEYDVQLFFRRARGWPRVWGEPKDAYRRAGEARY